MTPLDPNTQSQSQSQSANQGAGIVGIGVGDGPGPDVMAASCCRKAAFSAWERRFMPSHGVR